MSKYIKLEDAIEVLTCYFVPPIYTGEQADKSKGKKESRTMNIPKCSTCRRWKKEYWCINCNYEAKDLVDVIRCQDCKYLEMNFTFVCKYRNGAVKLDDFCSFAERKEQ